MTYENIVFKYPNMFVKDGYFYMFDHDLDVLVQKVDDGSTAFTYPLDSVLSTQVKGIEYGGGYFWTLQDEGSNINIKKWKIDNFLCKLVDSHTIVSFSDSDEMVLYIDDEFDSGSYDPPWDKGGTTDSTITLVSGEAVVTSSDFGSGGSNWAGPYLDLSLSSTSDFYIKIRFKYNMTSVSQMFYLGFSLFEDTSEFLSATAYDAWNGFTAGYARLRYNDSSNLYQNDILTNNAYNTFELSRTDNNVSFDVNGINRYSGTVDKVIFNKLRLNFFRHFSYSPPEALYVDYVTMSGIAIQNIKSETFSVENYFTMLSSGINMSDDYIYINKYYGNVISGTELRVGPNNDGFYSYSTVTSVSGNKLFLDNPIDYVFSANTSVELASGLWVFNDNSFGSTTPGALYKFNPSTFDYIEHHNDIEYYGITASTFRQGMSKVFSTDTSAIIYTKSTNLKFINVNNLSNTVFMTMDNLRVDGTTVIPIYDISIYNDMVVRLQDEATYYNTDNSWTSYNYQVSPIRRFVDSITVDADNKILNSDGVSTTEIISTVFDQYSDPIFLKLVFFEDDDDTGYMTISPAFTNSAGVAKSYYRAGTSPAHVTITATATQND